MSNEGGPKKSKQAEGAPAAPERKLTVADKRERQNVRKELRADWFDFVDKVRDAGLDRADIPLEWDRTFDAYQKARDAAEHYYKAVRPSVIERNRKRYEAVNRAFLEERRKAESVAERMLEEREAAPQGAPDRSAASPEEIRMERIKDTLARLRSRETSAKEQEKLKQELKQLLEEKEHASAGNAVVIYEGEAVADREESPAESSGDRTSSEFREAAPEDAPTERPDIIDAEFEDLPGGRQAPPEGAEETIHRAMPIDGPIVMVNPVLTQIAMGVDPRKRNHRKLDPFKPFPAAPHLKSTAQPRPSAPPRTAKKKSPMRTTLFRGGFIATAAAATAAITTWLSGGFDSHDGKKQDEARKAPKPKSAAEDTVQDLKTTTPPTMRASDVPPPQTVRRPEAVRPSAPEGSPEADPIIARREEEAEIAPVPVEPEGLDMKSYRPGDAGPG